MLGLEAEAWVEAFLEAEGWQVLDRNWSGGGGELDRVILKDHSLRFVEVKARAETDPLADDAITPAKRSRLIRAATAWLQQNPQPETDPGELGFMVVWLDLKTGHCRVLDHAFDAG
jgi:putative endonuclease